MEKKWPVPYWRRDRETQAQAPNVQTPGLAESSDPETWYDLGPFDPATSTRIKKEFHLGDTVATPQNPLATTTANQVPATQTGLSAQSLLHDLVLTGLTAASIFVKNPQSQAAAGNIINLVNSILKEHGQQL